jgi:mannose-6-phosphate isomerase-like protein (cupin superfamily)
MFVLQVGDRFENARLGGSFEVLAIPHGGGSLQLWLSLTPGSGKAIAHIHDDFVERFVVEAGTATARLGRRHLELGVGQELEVPVGMAHVNPYNGAAELLVMRQTVDPASPFALGLFATLGEMSRAGRVDRHGQLPLLAAFAVAHATRSQTYAAGVPRWLQSRFLFPAGARLARLRSYELTLPPATEAKPSA